MSKHGISRIVAVLVGAALLFFLAQNLGLHLVIALPAGILAYVATLLAMDLALGVNPRTK